MATVNVDVHYTKNAGGVKGFDKDSSNGTSFNNITYTSGWNSAFSSRAVTKVVFNVQVCLRGQYSGSITNKFTLSASYNGTSVTLGSQSFTRSCTGYSGNGSWPWTNFAIPSYGNSYLVFNVTDATAINFLKSYGKNMTVTLKSGNYKFYNQVDVIIDKYEYSDPPTVGITYPVASKTTYNTSPRIGVTGSTASGSITNYRYSFDNSTWTNTGKTGTSTTFQTSAQSTGAKTIYVQSYNGTEWSSAVSRSFTIGTTDLGTTKLSVIDDTHIDRAQTYITNLAAYYGNTAPSWTTCNANTELKSAHITELNTNLKALTPKQSFTVPKAGDVFDYSLFSTTINNAIKNS